MSNTLPVPLSVLNAHCAVLGKTGSGKSSLLRVLVEDLLRRGKRVCVIDPKGDWYGLKLSADGKAPGFPVICFGDFVEDKATDVPINEHSGRHVAELISSGNRPCVIGFRGWMPGKMTKFWIDFASTLFNSKSGELYLVGDEFHNFAPKGRVMDPEAGKSLHWSNRIMSEARGLGIVALIASQRPQKVHNDTLTCCETLFAMRVVHAADRSAIEDWIEGCGDKTQGRLVLDSLAEMKKGESFVWSPENSFGPKRVQFPLFTTFDSFAPPQLQRKISAAGWAGVDLEEVKTKLASVIEEAKANDPRELQLKIARLQAELRAKDKLPVVKQEPVKVTQEVPVFSDEDKKVFRSILERCDSILGEVATINMLRSITMRWLDAAEKKAQAHKSVHVHTPSPHLHKPSAPARVAAHLRPDANGSLGRCERAILTALAQYPQGRTVNQVAVLTGYSGNSGGFNNSLGKLRSAGLITRGQPIQATDEGLETLGEWTPLPTGKELAAHWLNRLGKCEREILNALLSVYPDGLLTTDLGVETGYSSNSGGFNNALGRMRTLELITRGQPIKASDDFFQ